MQSHKPSEQLARASGTSVNSVSYSLRKKKILREFIEALKKKTPRYDHFLVITQDLPPFYKMKELELVFVMLGGKQDRRKKVEILNDMLIDWIGSKRKADGGYPAPGTINSQLRAFFAATKEMFDWDFSPADFKHEGGYNGFFTHMCNERKKEDVSTLLLFFHQHIHITYLHLHSQSLFSFLQPTYGVKNKNCQLTASDVEKIDLTKFDESIHVQHIMKCLFGCGLYGCFRGGKEHSELSIAQISFGVFPSDFPTVGLRGKRYVCITFFANEKTHKISVHNSYVRDTEDVLRFPIDESNPACFGASLERLVKKAGPGQVKLYCREASPEYQATMALQGYPNATMYPTKNYGINYINGFFKEGAKILGLDPNFKPHSLRSACITKLANDPSVSVAETMAVARHSSVSASRMYQRVDAVSESNRIRALDSYQGSTTAPGTDSTVSAGPAAVPGTGSTASAGTLVAPGTVSTVSASASAVASSTASTAGTVATVPTTTANGTSSTAPNSTAPL